VRPLGLYIHVPFCVRKCGYCDFTSRAARPSTIARYVDALHREIGEFVSWCTRNDRCVATVFVGGGTPTLLPADVLAGLLGHALTAPMAPMPAEVTVEANPGTVDRGYLEQLRRAGANRLSLGVQSLSDPILRRLGRIHSAADALDALEGARDAGFDHISADLMFGVPGQTESDFRDALQQIAQRGVRHISTYALTYEPGTPFGRARASGEASEMPEERVAALFPVADEALEPYGLRRYEISNFAMPGHECRHNLAYWRRQDYRGLGVAAHSFVAGERFWNASSVLGYIRAETAERREAGRERLTPEQARVERVMLGFRLLDEGADMADLAIPHGTSVGGERSKIALMVSRGLVTVEDGRVRLTRAGVLVADRVTADLLYA